MNKVLLKCAPRYLVLTINQQAWYIVSWRFNSAIHKSTGLKVGAVHNCIGLKVTVIHNSVGRNVAAVHKFGELKVLSV